jgi:hypothetical protein
MPNPLAKSLLRGYDLVMKTFGKLHIKLNGLTPDEFGDRAEVVATDGWARDRSKDGELKRSGGDIWFTFTLAGHQTLPPAFLFLTQKSPGTLYVPNVISPAHNRLEYDEYNAILKSFCDSVLSRMQPPNSIEFDLRGTTVDLSTQLPGDVYKRLRAFSVAANKSTGSSHPYDRERWMDFLIEAVQTGAPLDPHTLARWLVEEGQWDAEQASRLAEEYEFGRELLERPKRAS